MPHHSVGQFGALPVPAHLSIGLTCNIVLEQAGLVRVEWKGRSRHHYLRAKALAFYTDKLGFVKKVDVPVGEDRWLTVVSPERPGGVELLLEPNRHPAAQTFQKAIVADGIPATSFGVDDVAAEYARLLEKGVEFVQPPTEMGPVTAAILDDTCGNLIQITSM